MLARLSFSAKMDGIGTGRVVKESVLLWMWVAFALLAVAGVAVSIFVNQR